MGERKLVFIVEADQGYIRNVSKKCDYSAENEILFSAISQTYIPLLRLLEKVVNENLCFKMGLVLSPSLCALLSDPRIQKQYIDHLDKLIEFGEDEVKDKSGTKYQSLAEKYLKSIQDLKIEFTEKYNQNLIEAFKSFANKGLIELIATAATCAYLPHFADIPEVLNAQVETGLYSQRQFFNDSGEGFWLPHLGWAKGFERLLRSYGANYTVVDARAILFSEDCPDTGIFAPVRSRNSLVLFGKDPETPDEIMGEEGFCRNEIYRNQFHDAGFDLEKTRFEKFFGKHNKRIYTGFKYWANTDCDEDEEAELYDENAAFKQTIKDALAFYDSKAQKLFDALQLMNGEDATLVCTIPAEILGQTWYEGIIWLENVIRCVQSRRGFTFALCRDYLEKQFTYTKIVPYPCSSNGLGYGEDLLDNTNSWMIRYLRKASQRMVDIAEMFPSETSLKERLLNLAAKQILLAQSSQWPMMIHDRKMPDWVKTNFTKKIIDFTKVFDALASNTVSTEWMTNCENESIIFPWLNYRIFCKKH